MTPKEKLQEIEKYHSDIEKVASAYYSHGDKEPIRVFDDIRWLISRIKKLEAALEEIAETMADAVGETRDQEPWEIAAKAMEESE